MWKNYTKMHQKKATHISTCILYFTIYFQLTSACNSFCPKNSKILFKMLKIQYFFPKKYKTCLDRVLLFIILNPNQKTPSHMLLLLGPLHVLPASAMCRLYCASMTCSVFLACGISLTYCTM